MKKKFLITTTIPITFVFFKDNLAYLNKTFDVVAISSQKDNLEKVGKSEGIKTHYIPMNRSISPLKDLWGLIRFLILFSKERPDIVHGNTPKAAMLSMIAAKLTGVKVRIYMCHGLRYQGTSGKMKWLLMQMEKLTCAAATEVICVSKGVKDTLIKDALCNDKKAIIIHHGSAGGIDLKRFDASVIENKEIRKELGIASNDFIFAFAGRIVKDKGINELVNAFVKLLAVNHSVHLLLIGEEENGLNPISDESRIQITTNENIHAVGWQEDIRPYLLASTAFVLPSYREGFGMVLLEAGALGLPCITSHISGCNEIIIQGENGAIIPSQNENELYEKMKEWLEQPEKIAYMAGQARSLVENRYEQSTVWKALLNEYKRLVDNV